ncbi:MAG: transposase family protein [bacterium]|nr:transposase family protein [bacterium]
MSDLVNCDRSALIAEINALRQRTSLLAAVVGLLVSMLRTSKTRINYERFAEGEAKKDLLRAIDRASRSLPLRSALQVVRLSPSRYHSWRQLQGGCELDDQPSCPRMRPTRLVPREVESMRTLAESSDYRHMSLRALALHAQRIGEVFASPSTWYRMARKLAWGRPRRRLYPAKPKVGVRASAPGELLHLDVTIIRLLDGTRAYLHAAIDNYSRRILSWTLEDRLGSGGTCRLLRETAQQLCGGAQETTVVADAGSENVNSEVDDVLDEQGLRRTLAQVDVTFSNSMIEAFWRSLKHSWLYLHSLESIDSLRRLVDFYVKQHNEVMPHAAFHGQTPNEMFYETGGAVVVQLAAARNRAREERIRTNRAAACSVCKSESNSSALQLRRPRSRMS